VQHGEKNERSTPFTNHSAVTSARTSKVKSRLQSSGKRGAYQTCSETRSRAKFILLLQAWLPYWHQFGAAAVGEGLNARRLARREPRTWATSPTCCPRWSVPGESGRIRGLVTPAEAGYK